MKTTTSNVQSPGLPSSFPTGPDKGRGGKKEARKEGKGGRVGEEGSWLVILYYFLMFNKKK